MSPAHFMMVDTSEFASARLECRQCHAAFSFGLTEKVDLPLQCFACHASFSAPGQTDSIVALQRLLEAFDEWNKAQAEPTPPFILRLELSPKVRSMSDRPGA